MQKSPFLSVIILVLIITLGGSACNLLQPPQVISTSEVLLSTETSTIAPPTAYPTASSVPSVAPSLTSVVPSSTPNLTLQVTPGVKGYCTGKNVDLKIPDRDEDENAPDEGWCGETSIQMALGYFGKNVSQSAIHQAGKPTHPDLWEEDISVALDALGVNYAAWDLNNKDLDAFMTWLGEQLQAGHPVVLGVKIYPDETEWDNDHFVLAVGCDSNGLIINTNNAGEGQVYTTYEELTKNFENSYSFVNNGNNHYGWAILGLR